MSEANLTCVLCGTSAFEVRHTFEHFYIPSMGSWLQGNPKDQPTPVHVVECRSCHLMSLYPLPSRELIEQLHNNPHYGFDRGDEVGSLLFAHDALRSVHEVRRMGGNLLDIGCSKGMFMAVARQAGWETLGLDFNADAVKFAQDVWGLNALVGNAEDFGFGDRKFDLITMWDVIEHLPNPVAFLQTLRGMLKPKGLLAFETPNAASLYAKLRGRSWGWGPHHLYYFTPETTEKMLTQLGFVVRSMETPNFNLLSKEGLFRMGLTRDLWVNTLGQSIRVALYRHRHQRWAQDILHYRQRRKRIPKHSFHTQVDPQQRRRELEPVLKADLPPLSVTQMFNEPLNALAQRWCLGDQIRVVAEVL